MKIVVTCALIIHSYLVAFFDRLRHKVSLPLILLLLAPIGSGAQVVDTAAVRREVDSLLKVSKILIGQRDFEKALEINAATENLALEHFGNTSDLYAKVCHTKGTVAYYQNNLLEAEKWWLEAKNIREKVLGKEHPDYAYALYNLAILYQDMGQYEKAEPLCIEAKNIQEKVLSKEHPGYASSLGILASLYRDMGQYEKAEPLYIESKNIREKALGKEHSDYAASLGSLANLYSDMGKYEKAEMLYVEAKNIFEKVLGKENPDYALSLYNLANLYTDMGQYKKAEMLYIESKNIFEKVLGKEHPYYAASLNTLANLYNQMGQYEKAVPLCVESKNILEKVLGKEHPHYATTLRNLASLYRYMGQYEKAEPLYIEAKNISEKVLGKEHPDYALSLNSLAVLYWQIEQYEKSEVLFIEAKNIWEKTLGKEHSYYIVNLNNLAILYTTINQYDKAESLIKEASAINKSLIEKSQLHLSEQELGNYLNTFSGNLNQVLSFAQISGSPEIIPTCYDNSLFYKGLQLQTTSRLQRLAGIDSVSAEQFDRLKGYGRRLSAEYAKPIAERKNVAELEEKANTLEKELVHTVAGFGKVLRQMNWKEVRDSLQPDEASIEFVRYQYYDQKSDATDSTMYAALLLLPGAPAPQFILLFEERQIQALLPADKAIEDLSKSDQRASYIQNLYSNPTLYDLLWAPIEKVLAEKNIHTVYFSPAGILYRLNLGAIADKSHAPLANRYHFVQLGSTRELVTERHMAKPKPVSAVVYGGVRYDMDSTAIAKANRDLGATAQDTTGGLFRYSPHNIQPGSTRDVEAFNYLYGTEEEARYLHALLQQQGISSTLRLGYSATEESFKQIGQNGPSPSLLHIGTHGFFFPDPKDTTRRHPVGFGDDAPAFKISEHPLIRSGLLLAGSKYAWEQKHPMPGMEDGILTAHEVSQMNLSNTDLVVLSACETGLGDIKGNEGVYGLQRAFRIAGAKNVLMSLWKVNDEATALLLNRFYENWLQKEQPVRAAFEEAQSWMRGQELYRNPYYWAGFVLVGE